MDIQKQLFKMQDTGYRDFQSKLMPSVDKERVIGVRTPQLRAFAKELGKSQEAEQFLHQLPHQYYEENNLHGMLIAAVKNYEECVEKVKEFLPYVDNWATCDLLRPAVFKKHLPELSGEIKAWIGSEKTYTVRFGIGILLSYYLDEGFDTEYLEWAAQIRSQEYYINMMTAWYFATALAKQYEKTLPYLTEQRLDVWTHNKTIQKAIESYRISPEQKAYLRGLKRKQ